MVIIYQTKWQSHKAHISSLGTTEGFSSQFDEVIRIFEEQKDITFICFDVSNICDKVSPNSLMILL